MDRGMASMAQTAIVAGGFAIGAWAALKYTSFGTGKSHQICTAYPLPEGNGVKCDTFLNAKGLRIQTYEYPPHRGVRERASILAVHGIGVHAHWEYTKHPGSTYEGGWIDMLNAAGYRVHLLDLQGHGRSEAFENLSCHVETFQDYVDDVLQFYEAIRLDLGTQGKVFIMGESMGGCICARLGQILGDSLDGIVLCAPMLSVEQIKKKPANKVLLPISSFVAAILPALPVAPKAKPLPHLAFLTKELDADPLAYRGLVRARLACEILATVESTQERAAALTAPALLIHNTLDTMTDPDGTARFFSKLKQDDKTLILEEYEGMWHALMIEPGNDKICRMVLDWLEERT